MWGGLQEKMDGGQNLLSSMRRVIVYPIVLSYID